MPNMSYCRFQNTLNDLRDCQEALDENALNALSSDGDEERAAKALIRICREIDRDHGVLADAD